MTMQFRHQSRKSFQKSTNCDTNHNWFARCVPTRKHGPMNGRSRSGLFILTVDRTAHAHDSCGRDATQISACTPRMRLRSATLTCVEIPHGSLQIGRIHFCGRSHLRARLPTPIQSRSRRQRPSTRQVASWRNWFVHYCSGLRVKNPGRAGDHWEESSFHQARLSA